MLALGALLSTVFSDPLVVGVYEGATRVALSGGVEAGQVRLPAQLGVEGGLARGPVAARHHHALRQSDAVAVPGLLTLVPGTN